MQRCVSRALSTVSAFAVGGVVLFSGTATAMPAGDFAGAGAGAPASAAAQTLVSHPSRIGNVAPKWLAGQPQQFDLGEYTDIPTVPGAQYCDKGNPGATMPRAGRSWSYYNPADDTSGFSADLTITGWGNATRALRDVRTDSGLCTVMHGWVERPWVGSDRASHLLLVNTRLHAAAAVLVVGTRVVAVTVTDWDNHGNEVAAAKTAAEKVTDTL